MYLYIKWGGDTCCLYCPGTNTSLMFRYLDNLSATESAGVQRDHVRDSIGTPHPKVWQVSEP